MDRTEAVQIILKRFTQAGRTSDLSAEGLLDGYAGHVAELVRALRDAGLLEHLRGHTRGAVYRTTALGEHAIEQDRD